MHYSTLACHAFTLFAISNAYPIHRWNRTLSDDSLSVNHERSQPRQAAPSIPTLVPAMKLLPSFFRPTTSSTSVPSGTSASGGPRKYVVAHHMVGNTYPYKPQDWADDIALAHTFGIDGFALNIGKEEWEPARVSDA
jgi:glucan endo-1,3-alpha-glucosidase